MVHLIDNPKVKVKRAAPKDKRANRKSLSTGELREIAQAVSKMIALTLAEIPTEVKELLRNYGYPLSKKPNEIEIIQGIYELLAQQDQDFILDLEHLISKVIPEDKSHSQYDNFGDGVRLYGSNSNSGGFGGFGSGSSSSSKFIDGATTIGSSTASGAAGGGIVGAALGAIGGIFGFANSAKQQKIEKQKAASKTLSDLLQIKAAKLNSFSLGQRNTVTIIVSLLVVVGIIATVVIIKRNKKADVLNEAVPMNK